ncbi:hypothetical protein F7725_004333 [Dissostichus mawsoni]|uniref:Uncharacterized protein n=1 Tax=Dissostichus mawsoni TaxID=36200 RepID=A0A7J5XJT7_DISMA|nr:hypothetical protein F7725_004333 [Dissostichus mawsoni]
MYNSQSHTLNTKITLRFWCLLSTDEGDSLVYFLSGALAFNSILVVLLAFLVYTMKKRNNCQSTVFTGSKTLRTLRDSFTPIEAGMISVRGNPTHKHTPVCTTCQMESLNPSHAGTYYCAVGSCGHIMFGDGTELDFEDEVDSLVYFLSGALAINSILVVLLAFLVYKIKKRNICQSTGYRDANSLHYAALSVNVPSRSRRQRNINNDECVYSGVQL